MPFLSAIMEALRPAIRSSGEDLVSQSIRSALGDLQVEHPVPWSNQLINTPWEKDLGSIDVTGLDPGTLGEYTPHDRGIKLDPGILDDPLQTLGTLSHETKHLRDDLGGSKFEPEMELPYGHRPHERRAFAQEFADVHNITSRRAGQPNLLPDRDILQLADNITGYGLDTHEAIKALQAALQERGSYESALPLPESLNSWRHPVQGRLSLK